MWKHKNFINLQLCAGVVPVKVHVNGELVLIDRLSETATTWADNASANTDKYTVNDNKVVWNDGTILQFNGVDVLPTDGIHSSEYTTRSATPAFTFKHFFDAGTIGSGTIKFRHYSQTEPSSGAPKVSIRYDDDYVSGYIAYSLDNGATWSDYITTQTTLLTDVTQIKFKCKGLDGGLIIVKGVYNTVDSSGTTISPGYSADTRAYETENITITEDTGFYYYCYYD